MPEEEPTVTEPTVEEVEEEEEPELPEEEDPQRLPEDQPPFPSKSPGDELELSDEQMDKQGAAKQAAAEALEDGDKQKALDKLTEAIEIGNVSAMMYTKRADILLKLKRPCACIADCDAAIVVNPDSGKAFRLRGKAYRRIGNWEQAHMDIAKAQMIDFDDDLVDEQKYVAQRWKVISERKNKQRIKQEAKDKIAKEEDYKRRKAQAHKEYEEAKKAESEGYPAGFPGMGGMGGMGGFPGMPGGMGGMPGGMGGMPGMPPGMDPNMLGAMMSDPELMKAFSDPKMMAAMQDIMSNPANMAKYADDPEIGAFMAKLQGAFGGMAGGMPGADDAGDDAAPAASSGPTVEEIDEVD